MYLKYLTCMLLLLSIRASAQIDTVNHTYGSYFFEGEEVVFEFDRRAYEKAVRASDSSFVDFADLGILQVVIRGNFNYWTEEDWVMRRVDEYRYQLRKHLKDFKDAPNWQFKFLINGNYWAVPNSELHKIGALGLYDLKNPDAPTPHWGDTGKVVFTLRGYPFAKRVILSGTFNNWDEESIHMKRKADTWEIHLSLPPGEYEYKFIVDGMWIEDPANREKRRNQHDTYNSVLRVMQPVRFELKGYKDASEVILAGSFNDWSTNFQKMRRTESGWWTEIPLVGGKHLYKFIVDGKWITDPSNRRVEIDLEGNHNSVLFVQ